MSLFLKMIYGMLTGAWGGFVAWLLLDAVLGLEPVNPYLDAILNGAMIGLSVGALTGSFGGLIERSRTYFFRGLSGGLLTGLIGGIVGLLAGELLYQWLNQTEWVRVLGWAIFGAAIGVSEGLLRRSWRHMMLGLGGGVMGGVLGSLAFVLVRQGLDQPGFSRALGFTVLGAMVGLFVGLAPVVASAFMARLRVVTPGRNEGKEILLDKPIMQIGRYDGCDLPLYGDKNIELHHAEIHKDGQGYLLCPLNNAPVQVNGQPVAGTHRLRPNDRISLGKELVWFG